MKFKSWMFFVSFNFIFLTISTEFDFKKVHLLQANNGGDRAYILYIPFQSLIQYNWENFHRCLFEFPQLLNKVAQDKLPVIIIMPDNYKTVSTTGASAPLLEGARTALAWASAYYRFPELGNVDVRVILMPIGYQMDVDKLTFSVRTAWQKNIVDDILLTKEQALSNRFFTIEKGAHLGDQPLSFNLLDNTLVSQNKKPTLIRPSLPTYSHPAKRIVITGGAGLIGSHLTKALLAQGHQVIVFDNLLCSTKKNIIKLEKHPNFAFYNVDVTQSIDIEGPVDIVIHLASVPSPAFYYKMPLETLTTGLCGTKAMLNLARKKGARFVFSSTSEVYGDPEVSPQPEDYPGRVNPIGKRSQYDQSKRGAETLIMLYFKKFNMDVRIARIFNTYGPGMLLHDGRVITNFNQAVLNKNPITIYGSGNQTRSFCYVSDLVDGLLALIHSEQLTQCSTIEERIFNVGNPAEFTINELAEKMRKVVKNHIDKEMSIKYITNPDPDDPKIRKPNISRITRLDGYCPKITLDEGLEKTFLYFASIQV